VSRTDSAVGRDIHAVDGRRIAKLGVVGAVLSRNNTRADKTSEQQGDERHATTGHGTPREEVTAS
jgi:hypothetical protein